MAATSKKPKRADPSAQEPAQDHGASASQLGARIRQLRRERDWSLSQLSNRSGIAISTLSKVENGVLSLTYDRLLMVATAFELGLSEFLAAPQRAPAALTPTGRFSVARRGSGTNADTPSYAYNYLCENLRKKAMIPLRAECRARSLEEFGPLLRHDGEEFTYVLRGRVKFVSEFYGPEILEEGEGVYIDSRMGHAYLNDGEGECWILSINFAPEPHE
jgi:transcriptional regulator with XRE-family HTH domain